MATKTVCAYAARGEVGSTEVFVEETFDRCLDLIVPLQAAASALEQRDKITMATTDGKRCYINPQTIVLIEEDCEPDD
jgi:hypothetical protein